VSQIGIKLANYDFFPIIDENGELPVEKELELTTVRDNQESVQINLFKADGNFEPVYIGSLIIEDLKEMSCGQATIILKLRLDENKNLSAEAIDKDSKNKQSLTIPINDLEHNAFLGEDFNLDDFETSGDVSTLDVSNFDVSSDDAFSFDSDAPLSSDAENEESNDRFLDEANEAFLDDTIEKEFTPTPQSSYEGDDFYEEKNSSFPIWLKIFLIVLVFGILALVVALFLKNKIKLSKVNEVETIESLQQDVPIQTEDVSVEELTIDDLTTEAPEKKAEPFPPKEENMLKASINNNDNNRDDKEKETAEEEVVKVVKNTSKDAPIKKAVRYRVRWGDTLWDISGNFYKNPWAYRRIARYNKIKNPHKIIAGTYITIPAK